MDPKLVIAKWELYKALNQARMERQLDDVEQSVFLLLENDIHIRMKKEGRLPWLN